MKIDVRRLLANLLFIAAALALLLAGWAWLTGGFRVYVYGVPLSARGSHRAATVAAILGLLGLVLHHEIRRQVVSAITDVVLRTTTWCIRVATLIWQRWLRTTRHVPWWPALAAAAAAFVLVAGILFGTRAAGGSDSYGYVSQVELWRRGELHVRQDFVRTIPWPGAEWSFTPLGYRPAENHTIVPTYAPGLPLLMLLFSFVFGDEGVYYVPWVAGCALVLLTYRLGFFLSGPAVGALAAVGIAVSPTVLLMTLWVMSDVPVSALWCAAILLAASPTLPRSTGAGLLAGAAVIVRPNLVTLVAVPFVLVLRRYTAGGSRLRRALAFALTFAPFPIFIGWLFNHLYGSPLTSGYGDNASLFSTRHITANLTMYPAWMYAMQGPAIFTFLMTPLLLLRRRAPVHLRAAYFGFVVLVFACYVGYLPFDAWWYTRFLLPAYPLMFILALDVVQAVSTPLGRWSRPVVVAFASILIGHGAWASYGLRLHETGAHEQRNRDIGEFVRDVLPQDGIVITIHHSGTVRHYSKYLTIRYDRLDPDSLDAVVEHLVSRGYEPFVLLEDWEVADFKRRFSESELATRLAVPPEVSCFHSTLLFGLRPQPGQPAVQRVPSSRCN